MELSEKQKQEIAEIQTEMDCPKRFACCESGFTNLCKDRYVVNTHLVKCIEMSNSVCQFKRLLGEGGFCKCLLRCYLAKNLGK